VLQDDFGWTYGLLSAIVKAYERIPWLSVGSKDRGAEAPAP